MKFELKSLNITVELNDELYNEYSKYDEVTEHDFDIMIWTKYGDNYQDVSIEKLSQLCNEVLLSDLKALILLPKAIFKMEQYMRKHPDNDELVDIDL